MKNKFMLLAISLFVAIIITKKYYMDTDISLFKPQNHTQVRNYKVWLVSFASHGIHIQNQNNLLYSSRLHNEFDVILPYQMKHIDPEYIAKHDVIFSHKRGAGYWLWKPYIILKTLKMMPENDVLLYVDSSGIFMNHIDSLLDLVNNHDFVLFPNIHNNRGYVKKIAVDSILSGDETVLDKKQIDGSILLIRNTSKVREIIKTWLEYCENPDLLTDLAMKDEYSDFIDHRHDQALLSILYYKNPQDFYLHETSSYKMGAFYPFRRRKPEFSLLGISIDSIWGIFPLIKMKIIDRM